MQTRPQFWEQIYAGRPAERLGWYQPHLGTPLAWIRELHLPRDAPIIDVGGGASTLVDDLLAEGFSGITVVDLSANALAQARRRLGERAGAVRWLTGDITTLELPAESYRLWHDRAAFHFLTEAADQRRYRDQMLHALKPDGHVILGTFSPEAPPRCSGLPVQRYSEAQLLETLGPVFVLLRSRQELHVTPGGVEQMYLYCELRKIGAGSV
ncbi:MAG: class I SAM-dependent methyltransferase [Gammaproteobacteria bacterium]|nr:class I SAM-dependent methyltransferase [Gammaproteobacteria bacterium]